MIYACFKNKDIPPPFSACQTPNKLAWRPPRFSSFYVYCLTLHFLLVAAPHSHVSSCVCHQLWNHFIWQHRDLTSTVSPSSNPRLPSLPRPGTSSGPVRPSFLMRIIYWPTSSPPLFIYIYLFTHRSAIYTVWSFKCFVVLWNSQENEVALFIYRGRLALMVSNRDVV